MATSKARSLDDDCAALKTKVKEALANSESPIGDRPLRALRKRLKRAQRKVRSVARQAAQAAPTKKVAKS